MIELKEHATLQDIQCYVTQLEKERGFTHESVLQKCLMLGEEVGECYEQISAKDIAKVADELADICIYVCAIANRLSINLEDACRKQDVQELRFTHVQYHVSVQDQKSIEQRGLLVGQAYGRLCKVIRKQEKLKIDPYSQFSTAEDSLVAMFYAVCALANALAINLETAFRDKEEKNKKRVWTVLTTQEKTVA